ncbi:MAG: hypothetical protein NXI13_11870 [Proteobacteria bacterium]|nr:hypothetical protein [Pseudomonadota bacterium]
MSEHLSDSSESKETVPLIDINNPDPWIALQMDQSLPMDERAKAALLRGQKSRSRRMLLPLIRPLARAGIVIVQLLRLFLPSKIQSSLVLHKTIYWGLKYFVSPDANWLILRHFNIGTEILGFIADNIGPTEISSTKALRPINLKDLSTDTFLVHDLNVFNFVIELNSKTDLSLAASHTGKKVDYSSISDGAFDFEELPDKWHNFLDLQTAIEIYTPLYALFLSDQDFWRASNSLQLDETMAIYVARIFGDGTPLALVHNGHPTVPFSTLQAGFRLMLHGLDAECLYGYIQKQKAGHKLL